MPQGPQSSHRSWGFERLAASILKPYCPPALRPRVYQADPPQGGHHIWVTLTRPLDDESRVNFAFRLSDDRLVMELEGPPSPVAAVERELSRAIIDATVDESGFSGGRTRLVKYLSGRAG